MGLTLEARSDGHTSGPVHVQEQRSIAEQARQAAGESKACCSEAQRRVAAVEAEMRALLAAVQRHKGASAAKMAQLAGLLQVRLVDGLARNRCLSTEPADVVL